MTEPPADLARRLEALRHHLPSDTEIRRILENLHNPVTDTQSRDRYVALAAGGIVEEALRRAVERAEGKARPKATFDRLIELAKTLAIITPEQAMEARKLREVRNRFAHTLEPIGFDHPVIQEATRSLFHHPVSDWASYLAPIFTPRQQFAIVCAEFYKALSSKP